MIANHAGNEINSVGRREKTGDILFISKRTIINLPIWLSKCS